MLRLLIDKLERASHGKGRWDLRRIAKDALKQTYIRCFRFFERLGLHILPVHYYSAVPDTTELRKTRKRWAVPSAMPGIYRDTRRELDAEISVLRRVMKGFHHEVADLVLCREALARLKGPGYGFIDSIVLHGMVRHHKPRRVIEVGSGFSSFYLSQALKLNGKGSLTCIEPYPVDWLKHERRIKLIEKPVQAVPVSEFEKLTAGDILFIDSSHVVRVGGDVNYLLLEILPRLRKGVIIHLHDIYFPYDYPGEILNTVWFWNENSLLRALLTDNRRLKILVCNSMLHYYRSKEFKAIIPEYKPRRRPHGMSPDKAAPGLDTHYAAAVWLKVTG